MVYLDDVIDFSRNFLEHLQHPDSTFQTLGLYGHKLPPAKWQLFWKQVKFLGHVLSTQGVSHYPDDIVAVADWQPPDTVR